MLLATFLIVCGASKAHLFWRAARFGPKLDSVKYLGGPEQARAIYDPQRFMALAASSSEAASSYMMEKFFSSLESEGSLVSKTLLDLFYYWKSDIGDLCKKLYDSFSYLPHDVKQILSILGGSVYVLYPRLTQQHYVKLAEVHLRAENALRLQLSEEQAMKICVLSKSEREIITNLPMRLDWWKVIDKEINTLFRSKILAKLPELVTHDLEEGISSLRLNAKTVEEFFTYLKGDMSLSGILLLEFIEQNLDEQTIMGYFDRLGDGPLLNDSYQRVAYMIYKDHHQELHLKYLEHEVTRYEFLRIRIPEEEKYKVISTIIGFYGGYCAMLRHLEPASSLDWGHVPGNFLERSMSKSLKASEISKYFDPERLELQMVVYAEKFGPKLEYRNPMMNTAGGPIHQARNSRSKPTTLMAPLHNSCDLEFEMNIFAHLRRALEDEGSELARGYIQSMDHAESNEIVLNGIITLRQTYNCDMTCIFSKIAGLIYLEGFRVLHVEYAKAVQGRIGEANLHCQSLRRRGFRDICKLSEEELEEFSNMVQMMNWWIAVEQKVDEMFTRKAHTTKFRQVEVYDMTSGYSKVMRFMSKNIYLPTIAFFEFIEKNVSTEVIEDLLKKVSNGVEDDTIYAEVIDGIYQLEYKQVHLAYAMEKIRCRAFADEKPRPGDWDAILTSKQKDSILALPQSKHKYWWLPIDSILSISLDVVYERRAD
jgi:hypothetical protein